MSTSNNTISQAAEFVLLCFTGEWTWWKSLLSAVLLILLLIALSANLILVLIIWMEERLHTPMYYLFVALSSLDFVLSIYILPPVLDSIWFGSNAVSLATCFTQIYFILAISSTQSFVFTVMAHDRYVAICKPLQYPIIVNNKYLLKAALFNLIKCFVLCMPEPILISQLNYCAGNVLHQCFCDLSIASLACEYNPVIDLYVFVVTWLSVGFDVAFIFFSYSMIILAVLKFRSSGAMSKAFSTCGSHLIVISYYYSSLIVLVIANTMAESIPTDVHSLMACLYCLIPPVINPLVYGLRTKEVKERVIWIFRKFKFKIWGLG